MSKDDGSDWLGQEEEDGDGREGGPWGEIAFLAVIVLVGAVLAGIEVLASLGRGRRHIRQQSSLSLGRGQTHRSAVQPGRRRVRPRAFFEY